MNILIDDIDKIIASHIEIPFNTDFRNAILFEILMQNPQISKKAKIIKALELFYPVPQKIKDIKKAIQDIVWFYSCGKSEKNDEETISNVKKNKQIYSFEYDSDLIFDAFLSQYGDNLQKINMHWWEFKAKFNGLNSTNKIVEIMEYRSIDLSKIKDKKQRDHYRKIQETYKLPDMRSIEEKEQDFASNFW